MQADLPAVRKRFAQFEDGELLRIAHAAESEYIAEVVALARETLEHRGIDFAEPELKAEVAQALVREREYKRTHDDKPLGWLGRVGCAIAGIIVSLIVAAVMMSKGRRRAAQDAIAACVLGMLAKLLVIGLLSATS